MSTIPFSPWRRRGLTALISAIGFALAACAASDDRDGLDADEVDAREVDASPDTADAFDATDAGDAADASDTRVDVGDVGLPATAERADVAVAWALQSTPGSHGVLTRTTLALSGGDLFVGAGFAETVTVGDVAVTATDETYRHQLAVRVGPDGTLRFARWLCDGCLGAAAEAPDGRLALARVGTRMIGNPGTDAEIDASTTTSSCSVSIVSPDGEVEAMAHFGACAGEVTAVAAAPDGGWFVGGYARTASFDDGTTVAVADEVFYPGQAFIAKLRPDLSLAWVETVGGTAASSVSMLAPDGDGVVVVGDYGGWPRGATSVFGAPETVLVAESSDDDPAMDLFVARWRAPGDLVYARRVLHYGWERQPTWLDATDAGASFRLDLVDEVVVEDGEPHFGYGGPDSARLRFDPAGVFLGAEPVPTRAMRWPGAAAWSTAWQTSSGATTRIGAGADELVFETPAVADEVASVGWVLGQWHADGRLARAGQLVATQPVPQHGVTMSAAVPQSDGSWLLYLNGSADVTLPDAAGQPTTLDNDGYERMIFLRAELR